MDRLVKELILRKANFEEDRSEIHGLSVHDIVEEILRFVSEIPIT